MEGIYAAPADLGTRLASVIARLVTRRFPAMGRPHAPTFAAVIHAAAKTRACSLTKASKPFLPSRPAPLDPPRSPTILDGPGPLRRDPDSARALRQCEGPSTPMVLTRPSISGVRRVPLDPFLPKEPIREPPKTYLRARALAAALTTAPMVASARVPPRSALTADAPM